MPEQTSRQHASRYLTLPQFKQYCGLGKRFLREAIKDSAHPLPHYRVNNKTILISTDDFDNWLQRYRVDGNSDLDRIVDGVLRGL